MDSKLVDQKEAILLYDLQKSNLKKSELTKEEVEELIALLTETTDAADTLLTGLEIASYASPDGPEDLNAKLVEDRGKSAQGYVEKSLKKAASDSVKQPDFVVKETTPTEDWEGFKKEVEGSELQDKELILRVLQMYEDPEVREREIKNMSEAYTALKDSVLPQLRRSVLKAKFESKVKSNEELLSMVADSNITKLKLQELLYAATLTDDASLKEKILDQALAVEPNCYRAYNNRGVVKGNNGDIDGAKADFEKANELKANEGAVLNNLGSCAFAQGNLEEAEKYFAEAKAANCQSPMLGYNMGVINIIKGEYPEAVQNFGSENSFCKALAQTLNKQDADAEGTLAAMGEKESGWFYYLKAIVAAKQGEKDEAMFADLKTAIEKTPDIKTYAKDDVEFIKYFENETFKTIVQ